MLTLPKPLVALQMYVPVSSASTSLIFRPIRRIRKRIQPLWMLRPSLVHIMRGGGSPSTGHGSLMALPSRAVCLWTTFSDTRGGPEEKRKNHCYEIHSFNHVFISATVMFTFMVVSGWGLSQLSSGQDIGFTLDWSVNHRADTQGQTTFHTQSHITGNLESPIELWACCWTERGSWRWWILIRF